VVNKRDEHAQVWHRGIAGPGWNELHIVGIGGLTGVVEFSEHLNVLAGFGVPVHSEDRLQGDHDGAGELHHVINPVAVGGLVLALDQVERADESALAVDDNQLAVVAQVRTAKTRLVNLQWQHQAPVHVDFTESLAECAVALVFEAADLVEEELHLHAALTRAGECLEERIGGLVPAGDIDFDVDVALRFVDGIGHGLD